MRGWPGSALREAEALMAKRHAGPGAASGASASDATPPAAPSPPMRVPILDVLGADELRLVVEALLSTGEHERAVHRLRCCARAFLRVITNDDVTRHVRKLTLGDPYRAYRSGFGSSPFDRNRAQRRAAQLPRQVFVGRRPRPSGVTRFSRREAPYELEVVAETGSNVCYINPVIVLDRSMGRYAEAVLLMDERGLLSEILC